MNSLIMRCCKNSLVLAVLASLFLTLQVKCIPQTTPPPSPPPSTPPPSTSPPTSTTPSSSPPSSTTPSLAPPSTSPAPPGGTLDPKKAEIEVKNIFDIINGSSGDKASQLLEIYKMYPECPARIEIEKAYLASQFNFDKPGADNAGGNNPKPDKEKVRLFMATLLFGCEAPVSYSYFMRQFTDSDRNKDHVRGITGILTACSASEESHTALQDMYNQRFATDDKKMRERVHEALGETDVKNVALELIDRKRQKLLDKPDEAQAKATADKLAEEAGDWSNKRTLLDESLMELPLNQCQLVVQKFSKDGKDLKKFFEDDFKDDKDKMTAYVQLYEFIKLNVTFCSEEIFVGIQENEARLPMRILTTIGKKADLTEIETAFQKDHSDMKLREKIMEVTSKSDLDYVAKFFQAVLDLEWGANSPATPSTTPPPPGTSPSTPPSTSTPPPSTPPPAVSPPPSPPASTTSPSTPPPSPSTPPPPATSPPPPASATPASTTTTPSTPPPSSPPASSPSTPSSSSPPPP